METYHVTLYGRAMSLLLEVRADDITRGPLDINQDKLNDFCGNAAMNFGIFSSSDSCYMLMVNVQRGDEPPVAMELVLNTPFGPTHKRFRLPEQSGKVPDGFVFNCAASFAVVWSEFFMATEAGIQLADMETPDAILALRGAFMQRISRFVTRLYAHITPVGDGDAESDDGLQFQVAEEFIFCDESVAYFTRDGVSYTLPDRVEGTAADGQGRYRDTSPMGNHAMVSVVVH